MLTYYFSGVENAQADLENMLENGIKIRAVMASYMTFRNQRNVTNFLKQIREKYKVKVMIDSGAHAFLFIYNNRKGGGRVLKSWHPENKDAVKMIDNDNYDEYLNGYMKWLLENRDAYDYAVEVDIQEIIGNERVEKWREDFIANKIPIVFVLHLNAKDDANVIKHWAEKGVTYFGIGGFDPKDMRYINLARECKKVNAMVHLFAYTSEDIFSYKQYIDSVDSTSWLSAGKMARLYAKRGRGISSFSIKEEPLRSKKVLQDKIIDILGREKIEKDFKDKKYFYLSFYNMKEIQSWVDANTSQKDYEVDIVKAEQTNTNLPDWAGDKDRFGRPKTIYLHSRFNAFRSGAYAKVVQKSALECNTCPVMESCPLYEENAICGFLPMWRKLGAKTRNREAIISFLENVVSDMYVRYARAMYFEERLGGMPDKQVTQIGSDLMKNLELLHRVKYGSQSVNVMAVGEQNSVFVGGNVEADLAKVRNEFGESLTNRIMKKLNKEPIVDAEEGDNGSTKE